MEEEEEMAPSSWFPLSEDLSRRGCSTLAVAVLPEGVAGSSSQFSQCSQNEPHGTPQQHVFWPVLPPQRSGPHSTAPSSKLLNFNNPNFPFVPPALGVAVAFCSSCLCNA